MTIKFVFDPLTNSCRSEDGSLPTVEQIKAGLLNYITPVAAVEVSRTGRATGFVTRGYVVGYDPAHPVGEPSPQRYRVASHESVRAAFVSSPPLISQAIQDLSVANPDFLVNLLPGNTVSFNDPHGQTVEHTVTEVSAVTEVSVGGHMQGVVYRGEMPQIERGWFNWSRRGR